jgi:hypothetical protein
MGQMPTTSLPCLPAAALSRATAQLPHLGRFKGPGHSALAIIPLGAAFVAAVSIRTLGPMAMAISLPLALAATLGAHAWLWRRQSLLSASARRGLEFATQLLGTQDPLATRLDGIHTRLLELAPKRRGPVVGSLDALSLTRAEESLRYALELVEGATLRQGRSFPKGKGG